MLSGRAWHAVGHGAKSALPSVFVHGLWIIFTLKKKQNLIFKSILGSQQNWTENTEISYKPLP